MEGNVGQTIDKWISGAGHMHHGEGIAFEPEGILSTLPSIVNIIAGFFAGRFIQHKGNTYETIAKLMLVGTLLLFGAYCWNLSFPINKFQPARLHSALSRHQSKKREFGRWWQDAKRTVQA